MTSWRQRERKYSPYHTNNKYSNGARRKSMDYYKNNDSCEDVCFANSTEEINAYRVALNDLLECSNADFQNFQKVGKVTAIRSLLKAAKTSNARNNTGWNKRYDATKSFREQILDISDCIIRNHISRSNNWSYKIGFVCHNCDFSWEVQHVINDLIRSISDPCNFLDSCMCYPPPKCMCPSKELVVNEDLRQRVEYALEGRRPSNNVLTDSQASASDQRLPATIPTKTTTNPMASSSISSGYNSSSNISNYTNDLSKSSSAASYYKPATGSGSNLFVGL